MDKNRRKRIGQLVGAMLAHLDSASYELDLFTAPDTVTAAVEMTREVLRQAIRQSPKKRRAATRLALLQAVQMMALDLTSKTKH
jgi:hypothetical protein